MAWEFSGDKPIYSQLVERLQRRLVTGEYAPGSRLPSVRDLAEEAAVNPNTMQRALAELEDQQLVFSQRTAGRFVTQDGERLTALGRDMARQRLDRFLAETGELGYGREAVLRLLTSELKEETT